MAQSDEPKYRRFRFFPPMEMISVYRQINDTTFRVAQSILAVSLERVQIIINLPNLLNTRRSCVMCAQRQVLSQGDTESDPARTYPVMTKGQQTGTGTVNSPCMLDLRYYI